MPAIVIIGAQWGDEGKGKATDLLGSRIDYVVKFNGGNNAGHTVVIGDEKYALHLLPSGILTEGVTPVIANGVVIDIEVLFDELDALIARGVDVSKLMVSANAHVITQYHRTLDKVTERFLGSRQIGTTGRGIGPSYADKINRVGIRIQDLFDENILRQKVEGALHQKNHLLVKIYNRRAITRRRGRRRPAGLRRPAAPDGRRHRPAAQPGTRRRQDRALRGRPGDHAGCRPRHVPVRHVIQLDRRRRVDRLRHRPEPHRPRHRHRQGVHDPRRRRPVPDRAERRVGRVAARQGLRVRHDDRPPAPHRLVRRPVARYAARINGVTDFVLTKLDVLTGLEQIPVCVAYDVDGVRFDEMPVSQSDFHHAVPIYENFPGWTEDISGARTFEDLPKNAQDYVLAVEAISGSRISAIGVGPDRDAIVVRHDLLD